ncbi:MAG TPA: hypothetical protein VEL51_19315 [Vicinamibacterales bacterium]|nr:hypothetical protein [Vicinamibacterales bacterium]
MTPEPAKSGFAFEKRRADAVLTLAGGETVKGCFFVAGSASHDGPERVVDLLNSEAGFFPFEIDRAGPRAVLYNRAHLIFAEIFDREEKRDPGYAVATPREVSVMLSNGQRIDGVVRVSRPEGRDRLSDWTRQPEVFRYVEAGDSTLIVNAAHIAAITEVQGP